MVRATIFYFKRKVFGSMSAKKIESKENNILVHEEKNPVEENNIF